MTPERDPDQLSLDLDDAILRLCGIADAVEARDVLREEVEAAKAKLEGKKKALREAEWHLATQLQRARALRRRLADAQAEGAQAEGGR